MTLSYYSRHTLKASLGGPRESVFSGRLKHNINTMLQCYAILSYAMHASLTSTGTHLVSIESGLDEAGDLLEHIFLASVTSKHAIKRARDRPAQTKEHQQQNS